MGNRAWGRSHDPLTPAVGSLDARRRVEFPRGPIVTEGGLPGEDPRFLGREEPGHFSALFASIG